MKKDDYIIGLDIGTSSVGWAVVKSNTQEIMKKGNKMLWGVRLFEEAETAENRRIARSTRRRYDRRRERIRLLQEEFKEEINKVDNDFYTKLKESKYNKDDKQNKTIIISKEERQRIKEYNKKYKTIYHLRNRLVTDSSKEDIRLVYLAIHHIIKYRGNFLYEGENFNVSNLNINEKFQKLFDSLYNLLPELGIPDDYKKILENIVFDDLLKQSKKDASNNLKEIFSNFVGNSVSSELSKLLLGSVSEIYKIFYIDEKIKLSFKSSNYEEEYINCETKLNDKIEIINIAKEIYNIMFLKKFLKDDDSTISSLMVEKYDKYRDNLKTLKEILKQDKKVYDKVFKNHLNKNKIEKCLYEKYVSNVLTLDKFDSELNSLIKASNNLKLMQDYNEKIKPLIEKEEFLAKTNSTDNGAFPYQLNKMELIEIIKNQGKYYPFLLNMVEDGTFKLVKLLEFKIPYYVGPLVSEEKSQYAWLIKKTGKEKEKITPYNFDEIVDKEQTAERFIKRMTSSCTYLLNEEALPSNSILYSEYKVMNELKQIKINGEKICNDIQHRIIDELFKKTSGEITENKFIKYLNTLKDYEMYDGKYIITGYSADKKFANNMQSYVDFFGENGFFKDTSYTIDDAEEIIEWITIFNDKDILKRKILNKYDELESKIESIINKNYRKWGNLSKKLLTTKYYKDPETEVYKSIIDIMYETTETFIQIIYDEKYKFQHMIKLENMSNKKDVENVTEIATSPANKRGIYQALKVVDEIVDYIGYEPKNIMIEMTRGNGKKGRTDSRNKRLLKIYEEQKENIINFNKLKEELKKHEISRDDERLYLYFLQEGKCLYSGEPIDINLLSNDSMYEVDHILPRSLIKDDSIDNKALVIRKYNQEKKNDLVLPRNYRMKQEPFWFRLKKIGLMSPKKFYNLMRSEYKEEDIEGFINRQLVETSQIIKHIANILENKYKNTKIVYPKASLSANYRDKFSLYKYRKLNDYHHAHDAYLAAVLGEYSMNFYNQHIDFEYLKDLNKKLNTEEHSYDFVTNSLDENLDGYYLNKIDIKDFNEKVEKTLYRNDILISRKAEIHSGILFKKTILRRHVGIIPIKQNMPVDLYGGYTENHPRCLMLVEYNDSKRKLIGIPLALNMKNEKELDLFIKSQISLKKNKTYKIIKNNIPFDIEMKYGDSNVYIKGYAVRSSTCELCNAHQLKIPSKLIKKWRYALNCILNDKTNNIEDVEKYIDDIYDYLINLTDFTIFEKEITKIRTQLNWNKLDLDSKKEVIEGLLLMYNCSSKNPNLKSYGLGDRIGRLNGKNIVSGTLIFKSTTGLWEHKYEFQNCCNI